MERQQEIERKKKEKKFTNIYNYLKKHIKEEDLNEYDNNFKS